ncbi:hypothetical protein GILI108418_08935 [Gillisia limnaea]
MDRENKNYVDRGFQNSANEISKDPPRHLYYLGGDGRGEII